MNTTRALLALLTILVTVLAAIAGQPALAVFSLFIAGHACAPWIPRKRLCVTLSATEILLDVIKAFAKAVPAARLFAHDFKQTGLKLNKTYTAHIAAVPTAEAVTTTYAVTGNNARNLLSDVEVLVDQRYGVRLYWENLYAIQDDKFQYGQVISKAGYALGKSFVDNLLARCRSEYFSQSSTFATADSDVDMLIDVCGDMNGVGADATGRVMLVNTTVANTLAADSRLTSRDFAGQLQGANGMRMWNNTNGYALIQEYADFPSVNGAAVTGGAIEADDDVYTKSTHGLVTGQRVKLTSFSGGTGLTAGTYWYFSKIDANTGYLCATVADAIAGTLGTACTVDATSVVLTPTENLTGFATDGTGIVYLAGPEDHAGQDAMIAALGVPNIINIETVTDPESGITMSAVSFMAAGTRDITWMPVLLWGKNSGRKAGTGAVGAYTDYGGHLLRSA